MAFLNKVMLIGNLTRDPELRYTPSGQAVAQFGLAINRQFKGSDGQSRDETCFVECEAWARRAEVICQYLSKGRSVFVEGRLKYDSWEDQSGQRRSRIKVVVENFQFMGRRDSADDGAHDQAPSRPARPSADRQAGQDEGPGDSEAPPDDVPGDEIPF